MKRTFLAVAIVLGFATAASAVSLTITSDKATYGVGETITLTSHADPMGSTGSSFYGRVLYSAALTDTAAGVGTASTQEAHHEWTTGFGGMTDGTWSTGGLQAAEGRVALWNQLLLGGGNTPPNVADCDGGAAGNQPCGSGPNGEYQATAQLTAAAAGTVLVTWDTTTEALSYFGLTNAPGTSFLITIPEPSVAALIGLGLVGLAAGGRRRS